jgi:ADP-L-glycero-D-manno-heptose 6-epimerase
VARSLFKVLQKPENIEYIPFDKTLEGKYQSFTQADLSGLRKSGYDAEFSSLEAGIAASVAAWQQ